jgi:hypothetical protein
MKLNKTAIAEVLNYVIDNQTFDFSEGKMEGIYLTSLLNNLAGDNEEKKKEIAYAIMRCINGDLIISNYQFDSDWVKSKVFDVKFKGFEWLENNA